MITAEHFKKAVGHEPQDDDLERSNCQKAGLMGHFHCGWDYGLDLPEFIAAAVRMMPARKGQHG